MAEEQNASEDLSQLPTLTLADVERDVIRDVVETMPLYVGSSSSESSLSSSCSSSSLLYLSPQPTNGVTYLRLLFSLSDLPSRLLSLVPFFADALTKIGAADLDFVELSRQIDLCSGGLHASPMVNTGHFGECDFQISSASSLSVSSS